MKRTLTSVVLSFVAIAAVAQGEADIIASYDCTAPGRYGKAKSSKMLLLAGTEES